MSQPPPYYNQQPGYYNPQGYNPYPAQNAPYPAGQYQPQPQVIYQEAPRRNDWPGDDCCCKWLATLACGCLLGEMFCDGPCLCCYIPIPCPRWR
ncbi:unnamed protein product, partial [Mesorhabditis belari]|uniref:Cysteine-rich transmembrane CYSTM domain-containing protein n=1 Tax=Mesorhabditis belari TaxID=2138241 RepID=A0AAF3J990_9BILA